MIVDGYNVIHAWGMDTSNLEDACTGLLNILDDYSGFSGEDVTVVTVTGPGDPCVKCAVGRVTVVYTAHGVTADTYIQRVAKQSGALLRVVTADWLEQLSVFGSGAVRITPDELKTMVGKAREKHLALLHRSTLTGTELKKRLSLDAFTEP
jgi:predicted RNA-binding protein with PIN domain